MSIQSNLSVSSKNPYQPMNLFIRHLESVGSVSDFESARTHLASLQNLAQDLPESFKFGFRKRVIRPHILKDLESLESALTTSLGEFNKCLGRRQRLARSAISRLKRDDFGGMWNSFFHAFAPDKPALYRYGKIAAATGTIILAAGLVLYTYQNN